MTTKQEALEQISQLFEQADTALKAAAALAKEHEIDYLEWNGPHSGMAGYLSESGWEPQNENWNSSYC